MSDFDDDIFAGDDEEEEKKSDSGKRPWWIWALLGLGALFVIMLITVITSEIYNNVVWGEVRSRQLELAGGTVVSEREGFAFDPITLILRNRDGECLKAKFATITLVVDKDEKTDFETYLSKKKVIFLDRMTTVLERHGAEDFMDIRKIEDDIKNELLNDLQSMMVGSSIRLLDIWFLKPFIERGFCADNEQQRLRFNEFIETDEKV